jgi:N-sulfoglucosamine sulfohydrolase
MAMKCFRAVIVLAFVCGLGVNGSRCLAAPRAPNILLLTADDLGCESVGCFGNTTPDITPNIDRLAGQGLRFMRAFTTCNICQPSRSVWITGRYPARNGAVGFNPITAGIPMLGEQMRKQGYFTGLMGKVEHFAPVGPEHWDFISRRVSQGRKPQVYAEELTAFLDQARAADRPFFVICNIHDPHRPFHKSKLEKQTGGDKINTLPSREYTAAEVDVPGYLPDTAEVRDELVCYYDTVKRCDDTVGLALKALDAAGQSDNALVMFLSDNGAPLPFGKASCYAHSTRTPWIVRWPGHIQPAVDAGHFISGIDLMPTILEIAGAGQPPYMDGRSFLPVLQGQKQEWRDHAHCVFHRDQFRVLETRSLHTKQYDYLFNAWSDGKTEFVADNNLGIMLPGARNDPALQQRVDFYLHRAPEELYDCEKDPWATTNLVNDPAHADVLAEMREHMLNHLEETGDPNTWTLRFYLNDHKVRAGSPRRQAGETAAGNHVAPAADTARPAVGQGK